MSGYAAAGAGACPGARRVLDRDGVLDYFEGFCDAAQSEELHRALLAELDWQTEEIVVCGRCVAVPRLVCWYAHATAHYRYSGVDHAPRPWSPTLAALRVRIEQATGRSFNGVWGNLYRDGNDSVGWHADNERSLGDAPCIASLSLGATRTFRLRHNTSREVLELALTAGSLLVMHGALQQHWRHCVPKTRLAVASRINLTFRTVHAVQNRDR